MRGNYAGCTRGKDRAMKCYHCVKIEHPTVFPVYGNVRDAIGVCQQCGEAVCERHAVKSDVSLPGDARSALELAHPVLLPILCSDCYTEIKALAKA
jgi:hypothetical protein